MDIEKWRRVKARTKGRRINFTVDNPARIATRRSKVEPKVEFRECKKLIIDFIRRHNYIYCAQNYLYDEEILIELSKKEGVHSFIQYQEWMKDKDDNKTASMEKWLLEKPFTMVRAIVENNPNKLEHQRRILHHKFMI